MSAINKMRKLTKFPKKQCQQRPWRPTEMLRAASAAGIRHGRHGATDRPVTLRHGDEQPRTVKTIHQVVTAQGMPRGTTYAEEVGLRRSRACEHRFGNWLQARPTFPSLRGEHINHSLNLSRSHHRLIREADLFILVKKADVK